MNLDQNVLNDVCAMIADVLAVEPEEVVPEARFFEDLGGESIDVLELAFRCEKAFKVSVPFQKLAAPGNLLDASGAPTAEGLLRLREQFPWVTPARIEAAIRSARVTELFTVETIARLVQAALAAAPQQPPGESASVVPA